MVFISNINISKATNDKCFYDSAITIIPVGTSCGESICRATVLCYYRNLLINYEVVCKSESTGICPDATKCCNDSTVRFENDLSKVKSHEQGTQKGSTTISQ